VTPISIPSREEHDSFERYQFVYDDLKERLSVRGEGIKALLGQVAKTKP
jgi:hypothetical protein